MGLRERKKLQTRMSLLEIAEEMFSTMAFDEVKVDEIVDRANISQKTFFNYFPSKAALLEELLLSYLREVNIWATETELEPTVKSALLPPNLEQIQDWVIAHRHLLKMIMQHTDLFVSVYDTVVDAAGRHSILIPPEYREPRLQRVKRSQEMGVIRDDVSAARVCELYDFLRFDVVKRWLALPDELATSEGYKEYYNEMIDILFNGLLPR